MIQMNIFKKSGESKNQNQTMYGTESANDLKASSSTLTKKPSRKSARVRKIRLKESVDLTWDEDVEQIYSRKIPVHTHDKQSYVTV